MSRELKFRAWNKELKVMREPFGLTDIAYGYDCGYKVSDSLPNLGQENHPLDIIMQYTGLKDKKGVEIYEGDVCIGNYAASAAGPYKNKVIWNTHECAFSFANSPLWVWDEIEVIGNVYEHPELLADAH